MISTRRRHGRFVGTVLPVLLATGFAAVATVHVVTLLRAAQVGRRNLIEDGAIRFEPRWTVVDLRRRADRASEVPATVASRLGDGWGRAIRGGRWIVGDRAVLEATSPGIDRGELVVVARLAPGSGGSGAVRAHVNGVGLGARPVAGDRRVLRWPLPAGVVTPGRLEVDLSIERPRPAGRRRTALVGGVAVTDVAGIGWPELRRPAVVLEAGRSGVVIRQPGTLVVPVPPSSPLQVVKFECRFVRTGRSGWPDGRGEIFVTGVEDSPEPVPLDASIRLHRRIELELGETTGGAEVRIELESLSPGAVLSIDVPRLTPSP